MATANEFGSTTRAPQTASSNSCGERAPARGAGAHWLEKLTGVLEMKLLGNPLKFDGERLPQRVCRPLSG